MKSAEKSAMTSDSYDTVTSPVRQGFFPNGPDLILLNPAVSPARWRRERMIAACHPVGLLNGVIGGLIMVIGIGPARGFAAVLLIGVGGLVTALTVIAAGVFATVLVTEHRHDDGADCRLERVPGEFFYRANDFRAAQDGIVRLLIAAIDELHRTPARAWLDPELPATAHRVAWQALCRLNSTRDARTLVDELGANPATVTLVTRAQAAIDAVEDSLEKVLAHIQSCLVLTRNWEIKLRYVDLAARTEQAVAEIHTHGSNANLISTAETLPQNVFAYITAARDVTGTGPFPWEQQPSRTHWLGRARQQLLGAGPGEALLTARGRRHTTRRRNSHLHLSEKGQRTSSHWARFAEREIDGGHGTHDRAGKSFGYRAQASDWKGRQADSCPETGRWRR
ncbi:hypothetical protein ACPZ19_04795 [Amycolatopsis lurida]